MFAWLPVCAIDSLHTSLPGRGQTERAEQPRVEENGDGCDPVGARREDLYGMGP
jgi:hypothetical protein